MNNKNLWYGMMASVVLGWLFVFAGGIFTYSGMVRSIWLFLILIFAVVHPLELIISLPIGKKAGFSAEKTVLFSLIFGFTWWLPVKIGVLTPNE